GIREEHDIVMCCCDEQLSYEIVFQSLHALDSFSSALLALECIHTHPLDISEIRHCNNYVFSRDEIFHGNVIFVISDPRSSVISVFFGNNKNLFTYHTEEKF